MLSISMAYNVFSYKKINRNTKKIEIADFIIEMTKNRPKVGSRNRDLLNFCTVMAYWMVPGESSCPGGTKYVCQRGVECV